MRQILREDYSLAGVTDKDFLASDPNFGAVH